MFDIKKHSLFGIISLILVIIIIIIISIEFVIVLVGPVIPEEFWNILNFIFDFNNLTFLIIITTFIGIIAKMIKKDSFGLIAIIIGVICFILNWILILFVLSKLSF